MSSKAPQARPPYVATQDGLTFAGRHLLVDLHEAQNLDDVAVVERALIDATAACGAELLNLYVHHFGTHYGVTGIAAIAESHMSIHTWPELGYAAADIFMCGKLDPHPAVPVFERAFAPGALHLSEHKRGLVR